MKDKLFSIGQAITPVENNAKWIRENEGGLPSRVYPRFGEIYHVVSYLDFNNRWFVMLDEINGGPNNEWYQQENFAPVVSDSVLEKELSEIFSDEIAGVK